MQLVLFLLVTAIIGRRVLRWSWLGQDWLARLFWGFCIVGSVFILELVGIYLLWQLTLLAVLGAVALLLGGVFLVPVGSRAVLLIATFQKDASLLWLSFALVADLILLFMLAWSRTSEPLVSPWNLFSGEPFILWGLASMLLLYANGRRDDRLGIAVGVVHAFVGLSVSVIVYEVGFGFDPFLHRAAEEELVANGFIEPKQWLYSGQYTLVSALHYLTGLSVNLIDRWVVPLLASFVLPIGAYLGLRDGWKLPEAEAKTWWMAVFLLPFMLATFTVPFTWTYVWFLVLIFLLPTMGNSWGARLGLLLVGLAMAPFQPLLAVPVCAWVAGSFAFDRAGDSRLKRSLALLAIVLMTIAGVAGMFAVYQIQAGQPVLISDLLTRASAFTQLFFNPFYDPYPFIPWYLQVIYAWRYWSPMVMFGIAIAAFVWLSRTRPFAQTYLAFSAGMLAAIYVLATLFYFQDIIVGEQLEFAKRLLTALYVVSLPAFAVLGSLTTGKWRISAYLATVALMLHSWYFSYPQFNLKYPFYSASVSAAGVEAVRAVDEEATGRTYLVLSDQMTSAAAIQEFHFAHEISIDGQPELWYAIPTGGPLYAYYSRAISGEAMRPLVEELHGKTGVDIIFLVLPTYWYWEKSILDGMANASDNAFSVSDGQMLIYEFVF